MYLSKGRTFIKTMIGIWQIANIIVFTNVTGEPIKSSICGILSTLDISIEFTKKITYIQET